MKIVKEQIENIPSWKYLYSNAPIEIKEYLDKAEITPQSPKWHPEAPNEKVPHNVLAHIRIVYGRAKEYGDINLAMAAFFHDLGKVDKTKRNKKGGWSAINHEKVSGDLVKRYSDWVALLGADPDAVYNIVDQHMRIKNYDVMRPSKRKEFEDSEWFTELMQFSKFDTMKNLTPSELEMYVG